VTPAGKFLDIRGPNGRTISVPRGNYRKRLAAVVFTITEILTETNVHAKPDLILFLCRLTFQHGLFGFDTTDSKTISRGFRLYTDLLRTKAVLLYQPFRYFISEISNILSRQTCL